MGTGICYRVGDLALDEFSIPVGEHGDEKYIHST